MNGIFTKSDLGLRVTPAVNLELKATGDQGLIEGYALTYGNVDQGDDICIEGCATDSLKKRPIEKVKMLLSHDPRQVIGKWTDAIDDRHGLYVKGMLFMAIQQARDTYELIKQGAMDGLSIGYRTLTDAWDSERQARLLKQIEIREISTVLFPMNENAIITGAKTADIRTVRDFEDFLRGHGFSAGAAKSIASRGFREDNGVDEVALSAALQPLSGLTTLFKRDFSQAERDRLARSGAAMPDGSFPITNASDLRSAIRLVGRAKDPAAAKRHIIKRARALGLVSLLPEDWLK